MKKITVTIVMILCMRSLYAQTWNEWFAQKKTQIKCLYEQIAALQTYAVYVKEGYSIVSKGINTINDIKNGDFKLHDDHFSSLKEVNPSIKNLSQVEGILNYQNMIIVRFKKAIEDCKNSEQFSDEEIDYINRVYNNMTNECVKDIDVLMPLITDDSLEMKDDERLQRINQIYLNMQDKYSFTMSFTKEISVLAADRVKEQNDVDVSKTLYNTK